MASSTKLRVQPGLTARVLWSSACLGLLLLVWWWATRGAAEMRIIPPSILPSPGEVFGSFKELWYDRALTRNAMRSLQRVVEGFGLAVLIGAPLGILAGCFPRFASFLGPVTIFGRNVPVAALVPLVMVWFGLGEAGKVAFIFIACVAFVIFDATHAIFNVDQKYLDTAYTLGASRGQVIRKVLVPMAMPEIFTSMRLIFGIGFGYIILAEAFSLSDGGIGALIFISERRAKHEHIYLCLLVITVLAYAIDRLLYGVGLWLFPYRRKR